MKKGSSKKRTRKDYEVMEGGWTITHGDFNNCDHKFHEAQADYLRCLLRQMLEWERHTDANPWGQTVAEMHEYMPNMPKKYLGAFGYRPDLPPGPNAGKDLVNITPADRWKMLTNSYYSLTSEVPSARVGEADSSERYNRPDFDWWYGLLREQMNILSYTFPSREEAMSLYKVLLGDKLSQDWFDFSNLRLNDWDSAHSERRLDRRREDRPSIRMEPQPLPPIAPPASSRSSKSPYRPPLREPGGKSPPPAPPARRHAKIREELMPTGNPPPSRSQMNRVEPTWDVNQPSGMEDQVVFYNVGGPDPIESTLTVVPTNYATIPINPMDYLKFATTLAKGKRGKSKEMSQFILGGAVEFAKKHMKKIPREQMKKISSIMKKKKQSKKG